MVRFVLAFMVALVGSVVLSVLDAREEWPRLLTLAAMVPFLAVGAVIMLPELERIGRRRRERR